MNPRLYTLLVIAGFACAVAFVSVSQTHGEPDLSERIVRSYK